MLKPKTFFAHSITKPLESTLEFNNFANNLQTNSVTLDKNGKRAPTQLAPPVSGQAYGLQFPDFFETQCWQPCSHRYRLLLLMKLLIIN